MRYSLNPIWLLLLYSIAGYNPQEIADICAWPVNTVTKRIRQWQIQPPYPTPKGESLRKYVDATRRTKGDAAARRAVAKLIVLMAGPRIRVYRRSPNPCPTNRTIR